MKKRKIQYKTKSCVRCGGGMLVHHNRKYCDNCRIIRNKERITAWQKRNPGVAQERAKLWGAEHKERKAKSNKEAYLRRHDYYLERMKVYGHQYVIDNPEKVRMNTHRRRARYKAAEGDSTPSQIRGLIIKQGYNCYYCNQPLFNGSLYPKYHIDHKIPLARGGSNDISNIAISCPSCNLSKGTKTDEEFITYLALEYNIKTS